MEAKAFQKKRLFGMEFTMVVRPAAFDAGLSLRIFEISPAGLRGGAPSQPNRS
jgi:hypothetical protein